jgi:hypothetical protein
MWYYKHDDNDTITIVNVHWLVKKLSLSSKWKKAGVRDFILFKIVIVPLFSNIYTKFRPMYHDSALANAHAVA